MTRRTTIRIRRDGAGPYVVVDPSRVEIVDGEVVCRLTVLEEAWLVQDLAELQVARVLADPRAFR